MKGASGRTAVLGAGALGLTVALRLAQREDAVRVYERQPLPGGLAAGFELETGIWLDRFYHHAFRSDRHLVGLIDELGVSIPGLYLANMFQVYPHDRGQNYSIALADRLVGDWPH